MLSINQKRRRKSIVSKSSGTEIKKVSGHRRDRRHTSQRHERLRGMPRLVAQRDARIALVPCGHQRFCEACVNRTSWNVRDVDVPSATQTSKWSCVFSDVQLRRHFTDKLTWLALALPISCVTYLCAVGLCYLTILFADSYTTNNTWNLYMFMVSLVRYH